jgi:hypothetical protein
MSSAAKNSVEAIRSSGDPHATEIFMRMFVQELSNSPPPASTSSAPPIFGSLASRRQPRR